MTVLPIFVRWARWSGVASLLTAFGAVFIVLGGNAVHARRMIVAALALGGAGLIASAVSLILQRSRRDPQDTP